MPLNWPAKLPRELRMPPYDGLMWNPSNETIIGRNKVLLREILCSMIGTNRSSYTGKELLRRYRREPVTIRLNCQVGWFDDKSDR